MKNEKQLCFSCERKLCKYTDGLCEECHQIAVSLSMIKNNQPINWANIQSISRVYGTILTARNSGIPIKGDENKPIEYWCVTPTSTEVGWTPGRFYYGLTPEEAFTKIFKDKKNKKYDFR